MKLTAEFVGSQITTDNELVIAFAVNHDGKLDKWIEKHTGESMTIDVKGEPRSLNANNYFWKLCELIAQKMGSTQDEIHDLMLYRYGERADVKIKKDVLPAIEKSFDIVLIQEDYGDEVEARCFLGSRFYDKAEMSRLIEGTVNDAKEQGIGILKPDEIERLVEAWEGAKK